MVFGESLRVFWEFLVLVGTRLFFGEPKQGGAQTPRGPPAAVPAEILRSCEQIVPSLSMGNLQGCVHQAHHYS